MKPDIISKNYFFARSHFPLTTMIFSPAVDNLIQRKLLDFEWKFFFPFLCSFLFHAYCQHNSLLSFGITSFMLTVGLFLRFNIFACLLWFFSLFVFYFTFFCMFYCRIFASLPFASNSPFSCLSCHRKT